MQNSIDSLRSKLADLLSKFAVELAILESGKDNGLLPINSFVLDCAELVSDPEIPAGLRDAAAVPRRTVDQIFDTTGVFDEGAIEQLAQWHCWLESAIAAWAAGRDIPANPAAHALAAIAAPAPASVVASSPSDAPQTEPVLELQIDGDRDLLAEFINESQEHLQNIEQGVLVLEENPTDSNTLNSIFRAFHTFKGGAGFLNLTAIKDLAHELESLLDAARQHRLTVSSAIIDVILEGGDTLKDFVGQITSRLAGQEEGAIMIPTRALITRVQAILADPASAAQADRPAALDREPVATAQPLSFTAPETLAVPEPVAASAQLPAPDSTPPAKPKTATAAREPAASQVAAGDPAAGFVKVDTHKLDSLIEIVGELVIAQSMVVQDAGVRSAASQELTRNLAQLRRTTNDLQRTAMSLRMVPIRSTFQKMNRLVRDLASKQQKQVALVVSGEDTELDRTIVGELSDPLIHMIRNSVDHGIEKPEARLARGKSAEGTVRLSAFHQGGSIVIQIRDDGNGLNKDRILDKAIEKGLVKPGVELPDKDIYDLIFAPGFSTADSITDISGRGVGMDVVRRNIENLRGKIDITSAPGQGTTFTIYLPLTLAIIDGMIVGVGGERYIIPTLSVRESFRPHPEMISTVNTRGEMVNVRGRLTPMLRLYRHFGLESKVTDPAQGILVVVESGTDSRCLMVDELLGKQEVVIKSLGHQFKQNRALAGGAILGDGRVGLILNVDALVKLNDPGAALAA